MSVLNVRAHVVVEQTEQNENYVDANGTAINIMPSPASLSLSTNPVIESDVIYLERVSSN